MAAYARRCQSILKSFLKSPIHSCSPTLQLKGNHSLLHDFDSLFHSCAVRQPSQYAASPTAVRSSTAFDARRAYHSPARSVLASGSSSDIKAQVEVSSSQPKGIEQSLPQVKNRRTYSAATATYSQQYSPPRTIRPPEDVKITQTAVCHVKPALQVEEHWFPLSNMDRLMPSVYEHAYFVYESTKGRAFGDIVASLKRTLSEVLVPYYPLAGRMRNPEEGIYNVHCDGTGAEFAEAYADCDLEELDYHQPGPVLGKKLAPTRIFTAEDGSLPPVSIQITRFKCGGVIVGCSFHHQIVDAHSGNMFLKAWSQNMRSQPISRLPYHWRSLLQARNPPVASVDHSIEYKVKPKSELRTPRIPSAEAKAPIVARTFHFDNMAIRTLKRETSENGKYGPFTSTECTSTYLWRLIMKANGFANDENATGRMIMSVDGRKRLQNPCVPEDYFGNMIAISSSECSMGELVHQPLANAATKVQKSIARTATDENFRSLIDYVETNKGSTVMPNFNVFTDKVVIASSCIYLGMYEIDFGWGRPQYAGYATIPDGIANFVILLPSPLGYGNLNASVHMRADHMEKLEKDPEFEAIASANEPSDRSSHTHHHHHHHAVAAV
ncbi:hypothetical protein Mapa_017417 [Marchantia paleacea]|nr:hypothetical protein Mapa_017417 [Marchantia paleacea]